MLHNPMNNLYKLMNNLYKLINRLNNPLRHSLQGIPSPLCPAGLWSAGGPSMRR